jgi:hypothetical protein
MRFGREEEFAIECAVEPDLIRPSAVWGRMRVWCEGEAIGDFSEAHCALYPAYKGFCALRRALPRLWREEFVGLPLDELWNRLDGLLYGYHGDVETLDDRSVEACRRDSMEYGGFSFLTNWGEQFDRGGKSFIFCPDGKKVLVLNRALSAARGIAVTAPLEAVLRSIDDFTAWFEREAARLTGGAQ